MSCEHINLELTPKTTGRAKKVNPKEKLDISGIVVNFSPNLYCLQRKIQTTHCANFVAIFGCVQKL